MCKIEYVHEWQNVAYEVMKHLSEQEKYALQSIMTGEKKWKKQYTEL
jgi:hypothetical protein